MIYVLIALAHLSIGVWMLWALRRLFPTQKVSPQDVWMVVLLWPFLPLATAVLLVLLCLAFLCVKVTGFLTKITAPED